MGAGEEGSGRAFGFVPIDLPQEGEEAPARRSPFSWTKRRQKAERRDGHYLLRSNLLGEKPDVLWELYILLTQ